MTTPERHDEICEQFLAHAAEEHSRGDYLQAAEKAWGAFAHCAHSIAIKKGWKVGTHRLLRDNAIRLIDLDPEHAHDRRLLLSAVESLHTNFYKELMTADEVSHGIANARVLVEAMRALSSR